MDSDQRVKVLVASLVTLRRAAAVLVGARAFQIWRNRSMLPSFMVFSCWSNQHPSNHFLDTQDQQVEEINSKYETRKLEPELEYSDRAT